MIKNIEFNSYKIYYPEEDSKITDICKAILLGNYRELEVYKDSERNYVGKIEVKGKIFVLKSPRAEAVIPQRKVQSAFKKGEALNSLLNLHRYKDEGIDYFITPRAVMVKRGVFIENSYILMDFIEGENLKTVEDIDEVMKITEAIHKKGIYHGDLNTSNFIKTRDGIKIIDTQGKREKIWNFKRAYDILTLKRDLLVIYLKYDVEKNYKLNRFSLGYMLAYLIKEFKNIPLIKKIRGLKVKLRNMGFKI